MNQVVYSHFNGIINAYISVFSPEKRHSRLAQMETADWNIPKEAQKRNCTELDVYFS